MRPRFETEQDKQNEEELCDAVGEWLKGKGYSRTFRKMPKMSAVDYAACNGNEVTSWFEMRCRTIPSTQYKDTFIDYRKLITMLEWSSWSSLPLWFVVSYSDDVIKAWNIGHKWRNDVTSIKWLYRKNPRDSQDNAPIAIIKPDAFIIIRDAFKLQST